MQLAQFYPDRISISTYKKRSIVDVYNHWESQLTKSNSINNLKLKKTSVNLSKNSKRNLLQSCNSLFYHSPRRTIKLNNNKFIYNYKASFITLTLPSSQMHTDVEIKERLNVFLQLLRDKYGLKNYIWKAELQANENIHFHLIIDIYINYGALKYYWNKSIKPLGYIDEYQKKFQDMTLTEYVTRRAAGDEKKIKMYYNNYKEAYIKGNRTNWREPNSIDVKSVQTTKNLSHYLAKYFVKSITGQEEGFENEEVSNRVEKFGKVWARSQSLSRLKFINKIDYSEIREIIQKLKRKGNCIIDKTYDYCRVIYLKLENCPRWFVQLHRTILRKLATLDGYPFPTT